ncbi:MULTISPECIES: hypothetical protein [Pacificibacter]|uniref:hypothetical protein n=1 Tax=Pacificibacter TaxID=1042323 RepID=UPI001C0986F6|nr:MULTISPECIES: hypothetical protein [Pacificibacter]MBU2935434.1 hypothetical protein [Pacificibacter marinus]MDO6615588.1 hypothetical protein [Pacificibacter sp. 1_MG-2023]
MPKLIRLYITQVLIGFAISAAFVGVLLAMNVANLWHLVTHSDMGILAVVVLWLSNGIVFSGVQFAISVMRMADRDDGDQGGKRDAVFDEPLRVTIAQGAQAKSKARRGF